MPYVNVRITNTSTNEQKTEIVKQITETLRTVLGKNPAETHIIIDEISEDNWGYRCMLTTDYRRLQREGKA